jgi:hypothetical protein
LKDPLPDWFFEIYDALIMNKSVHKAENIGEVPFNIRLRVRTVNELMKRANVKLAKDMKAFYVYDVSQHHKT